MFPLASEYLKPCFFRDPLVFPINPSQDRNWTLQSAMLNLNKLVPRKAVRSLTHAQLDLNADGLCKQWESVILSTAAWVWTDPFQMWRHVTWFIELEDKHQNKLHMFEDRFEGILEVFAQWWTFVLCLAAQIVQTERRTKDITVFLQSCRDQTPKRKLWASNVERLGSPGSEGKILRLTLLNFTEFAVSILYQVLNLV